MKIRLASKELLTDSSVDGEGLRSVIWTQGWGNRTPRSTFYAAGGNSRERGPGRSRAEKARKDVSLSRRPWLRFKEYSSLVHQPQD